MGMTIACVLFVIFVLLGFAAAEYLEDREKETVAYWQRKLVVARVLEKKAEEHIARLTNAQKTTDEKRSSRDSRL